MDPRLNDISTRYIGERTRELWDTFSEVQKTAILEDAEDASNDDWSDGIDAMGEDA